MFEPEHQDMTCPKCHHRKVYFDREIGYYCMFCGHEVSTEGVDVLIEHELCQIGTEKTLSSRS